MKNFLLFKFKKICIFIGPYEIAFNDYDFKEEIEE